MKYLKGPIKTYLESSVLKYVQEAMLLADEKRPNNPLEFIGNYLLSKSKQN